MQINIICKFQTQVHYASCLSGLIPDNVWNISFTSVLSNVNWYLVGAKETSTAFL